MMCQWGLKQVTVAIIMNLTNFFHLLVYTVVIKRTAVYFKIRKDYTVPKHGDLQKIIKDGWKLQRWMAWGDPLEYQEKIELEM